MTTADRLDIVLLFQIHISVLKHQFKGPSGDDTRLWSWASVLQAVLTHTWERATCALSPVNCYIQGRWTRMPGEAGPVLGLQLTHLSSNVRNGQVRIIDIYRCLGSASGLDVWSNTIWSWPAQSLILPRLYGAGLRISLESSVITRFWRLFQRKNTLFFFFV